MTLRVKGTLSNYGIRDALAVDPWVWCETGQHIVKEKEMAGVDICHACNCEIDERRPNGSLLKSRKDKALPIASGERGKKTDAPVRQMELCLIGD